MRYAAIGDSFTEGIGDERPDGSPRGWADLVAEGLAAALGEPVSYANFAVRGRLMEPIVTDQLEAALKLSPAPTVITLNGGGNDMMRPGMDVHRVLGLTERAVRRCQDAGVQLVVLSGADPSQRLPFGRTMHQRGAELTVAVKDMAARHGLTMVDMFNDAEIRKPAYWSPDRLHLNAAGHHRVAAHVLTALGHTTPSEPLDHEPEVRRLPTEARYYREHVLPWLNRRLRRRSSGDTVTAKHPTWTTIDAQRV